MMEINVLQGLIHDVKTVFDDPEIQQSAQNVHDDFGRAYEHAQTTTRMIVKKYPCLVSIICLDTPWESLPEAIKYLVPPNLEVSKRGNETDDQRKVMGEWHFFWMHH